MEAVAKGDMKTAQRMVDAAAEAAGYTVGPVYHGTKGKKKNTFPFTVFDTSRRGSLTTQVGTPSGSYFTPNKRYAEGVALYASNMGKSGKPVVGAFYLRSDVEKTPGVGTEIEFFATNPSQIKSADPVTYDDSGNVIPLSQRFDSRSEDIRNPRQLMGININDSTQDFTGQILRGEKTIETRSTRSLDPYIGNRVGIIRTGVGKATLVGYATVGEPVFYDSVAKFRRDQSKHLVAPGSAFDIKDRLRYGYPLMQVEPITPKLVQSKGIVARKLNPKDPRSAMTQITGTEDTYINASKMLGGKVLDYGAGRGIGTDALRSNGLLADSFEPFPENWEGKRPPTYTDSANIPSSAYDSLVSFSVINVVDPDERKFLFKEVARILRPDGVALITGRDRQDVQKSTTKIPHLEEGGYLIGKGKQQRYQKGFTQAELERYAKEVLGPDFTVEKNGMLNGASIKITKGKTNPTKRNAIRNKLSRIIESDDRILCYDTATDEDFYRLWDIIHTDLTLNKESLREIEGMLDDDGVLVIESGESPAGLQDHFRKTTRYQGLLLVQGPLNPEQARIETEKLRRDLE
jgi:SAM-dependent methyltransferase